MVQNNGQSNHFDFQIKSFRFKNQGYKIYFHCTAVLCDATQNCEPQCPAVGQRRRRSMTGSNERRAQFGPLNLKTEL